MHITLKQKEEEKKQSPVAAQPLLRQDPKSKFSKSNAFKKETVKRRRPTLL
jgi:hypothetical protein